MRRLAIRTLAAHRARLAMTLAAVCLGAAFVAGTMLFTTSTARAKLTDSQRTDIAVQVSAGPGARGWLPRSTVEELARLPGVAHAQPVVSGQGSLIGRDGKVVEGAAGVTNFAATARFAVTAGRPPARAGEAALSGSAARTSGARVGDTVDVLLGGSQHQATVVGVYDYRTLGQETPPAMAFDTATTQRLLGHPGQVTAVDLVAKPGTAPGDLISRAQPVVPEARAVDAQAANEAARRERAEATGTLRNALLGFAAIALLVGTIVIANTFSMLVGQRTRELALLRAVGMSRRQVRWMVLGEAAVIGLLGGVAGTAVGYAFAALAVQFLDDNDGPVPVVVSWPALLAALAVGVGVTVLSAYASARRAARIPPIAALRSETTLLHTDLRRRTIAGLAVTAFGAVAYGYAALTERVDEQLGMVGLAGAALLILGVVLLAPALSRLGLAALSAPLARFGVTSRLAAANAQRNPRRTAATATALMISLSVVTGLAIGGQSLKDNITASVRRDISAQLVAEPTGPAEAIPQGEVEQLAAVPGVRAVAALRYAYPVLRIDPIGTREPLTVVDPAAIGSALRLSMVAGRSQDLATGVFVSDDLARSYGLSVGDQITVSWPRGGEGALTITGVYQGSILIPGMLAPQQVALPHLEPTGPAVAFVALAPGADQAAVRAGLERAVADRPDVVVRSLPQYLHRWLSAVDLVLRVSYALLALAVLIGLLGVANTLALSVLERTRELGLLRALGLTRRQVRTLVRVESALVAVLGGLLGIGGGYLLGAMFQRTALHTGLFDASVPAGRLLLAVAGLAVVGMAAAAWPARRAAKTNLVAAIAAE
jgi:putative ABC transport system permease protein